MHIGVIGTGYVGLVTGACFAEFGVFVVCVDKDEKKIESLRGGAVPFYEPGLEDLVRKNVREGRLRFSTRVEEAVKGSLAVFIAVGTPPRGDGSSDLRYVEEVAAEIARHVDDYKVIVTKSTVPVGTGARVREIISRGAPPERFDVASNPEFLREGSAIDDFKRPNRVVIGAASAQAVAILKDLYRPLYLIDTPFVITSVETAEIIKYASNAFLAVKISFINEIALLCEKLGADVQVVAKGMGMDGRIGAKFLHAGPGYGGSCFPKDTRALLAIAGEAGAELGVVRAGVDANERQKEHVTARVRDGLGGFAGRRVAILGLAFKPETDDIREAPAVHLVERVLAEGGEARGYDPAAAGNMKQRFPAIECFDDPYEAARGADAAVLVTEWNQLRNLDTARLKGLLRAPLFFDLRNVYVPERMREAGFTYYSVGRP